MQLRAFRVQSYKNIQDSGWVAVDNLTALVGKNEAGKTALLRALHKFNPYSPMPYSMEREWPRGHRRERDSKQIVCSAKFELTAEESAAIEGLIDARLSDPTVMVTKNYEGQFEVSFPEPISPEKLHPNDVDMVCELLPEPTTPVGEAFLHTAQALKAEATRLAYEGRLTELSSVVGVQPQRLEASRTAGNPTPQHQQEAQHTVSYVAALTEAIGKLGTLPSVRRKAHEYVVSRLPTFIYMDEYRAFTGTAQLDQVQQRKARNALTPEDETLLMIMSLSGLDLEEEVKNGHSQDREQRQYDLDDASQSLTTLIEGRWHQRKYEIQFRGDGQHFFTLVKDERPAGGLIPLEDRSKGFQWFFSFDLLLMHESRGAFEGCVLLLDEPGLHLHPDAQTDLLQRLEAYAERNVLIYTTHLPFMLDLRAPERIRILSEREDGTAFVTDDVGLSKPEEKLTLQAALGIKGRQSFLVAQRNLVVEGVGDFMILNELSNLFWRTGKEGIAEDVFITAAGGAREAVYVATFMIGQELEVLTLFDSDQAGRLGEEKLRKKWLTLYKNASATTLLLGDAVGAPNGQDFAVEDLFPSEYYLKRVEEVYGQQLSKSGAASLKLDGRGLLCDQAERALNDRGIQKFNKGAVAKRIRAAIRKMKSTSELPGSCQQYVAALLAKIRETFTGIAAVPPPAHGRHKRL